MAKRAPVTAVEYFIQNHEKRDALNKDERKLFWSAREWHPVVQMLWDAETSSNGSGLTTYPNGSICSYQYDRK